MAESYGLFNGVKNEDQTYDRVYLDIHFAQMMSFFVGQSGYIPNYKDELEVVVDVDTLKVKSGRAWLGNPCGWWYENDGELILDHTSVQSGEYWVGLKMDRETTRVVAASILKPTNEGLINDENLYEIPLAKISIDTNSNVTIVSDERIPCIRSSSGIAVKGQSWTLSQRDMNKFIKCTNSGAISIILPANESIAIPINSEFVICQYGAGTITISPSANVTLRALDNGYTSDGIYSAFTLRKTDTNEWIAVGALTS